MDIQAKKKTFWSTFKNAYLRSRNLKRFWKNIEKKNLSPELIETFDIYLTSESYNWSSKFWKHLAMRHLELMAKNKDGNNENIISQEYFTFTYFNEPLIKDACSKIEKNNIELNVNLFKKQNSFTWTQSLNHNLILLLLYENIKSRKVFNYFDKLKNFEPKNKKDSMPSLKIDKIEITQDKINSLFEFEQIEKLLDKINSKNKNFLEIGAGAGRTAKTILSIINDARYVIADIPPAINICYENLCSCFPNKKIAFGYKINDKKELNDLIKKNDILFIFPHQIKFFEKKTFDISLAIDCLHEMDQKIIKKYMDNFENVSKLLYFKVWESAGLPYSFYKYYSVHKNEDYSIKSSWKEHLRERCLYPSNFFQLGYEFD